MRTDGPSDRYDVANRRFWQLCEKRLKKKKNLYFHKTLRMTQRLSHYLLKPEALKVFEISTLNHFINRQFMILYTSVLLRCWRWEHIALNLNALPTLWRELRPCFITSWYDSLMGRYQYLKMSRGGSALQLIITHSRTYVGHRRLQKL